MNRLRIALLLGLCACAAQAAEQPAEAEAPGAIRIFRGQWTFLKSSTLFCAEKVPEMKRELERARDHAEVQMARAEIIVLEETEGDRERYKPWFDMYASAWTKYAGELVAALKRQDARKACPDLLQNWQATDIDIVLEDWRGFVERNGLVPEAGAGAGSDQAAGKELHGA